MGTVIPRRLLIQIVTQLKRHCHLIFFLLHTEISQIYVIQFYFINFNISLGYYVWLTCSLMKWKWSIWNIFDTIMTQNQIKLQHYKSVLVFVACVYSGHRLLWPSCMSSFKLLKTIWGKHLESFLHVPYLSEILKKMRTWKRKERLNYSHNFL